MKRFRILRPLGSASGLPAYLVSDLRDAEREKVLTLGEGTPAQLERWMTLRLGAAHPQLVPVTGIGCRGRRVGLLSEPPPFPPVDLSFRRSLAEQLSFALDLVDLLGFLHSRGLVVGVLTPRHLLGRERRLECLDLVWPTATSVHHLRKEVLRYAAPEIWDTGPSVAADSYSLGLVLYQLFTGCSPYSGALAERLPELHDAVELRRPRSLFPDLPDMAEQAIRGLTRKDPQRRLSPQAVTTLLAAHPLASGSGCAPGMKTPVVGREQVVKEFSELLRRWLAEPRPHLVAVTGVKGIGKSALLRRLEVCCVLAGLPVFQIRHQAGTPGSGGPTVTCPRQGSGEAAKPGSLPQIIRKAGRGKPFVLLVENLQLASGSAVRDYSALLQSELPVLLVVESGGMLENGRLNHLLAAGTRSALFRHFPLGPLSHAQTEELVRQSLSPEAPRRLSGMVSRQSGGNPGYAMALLQELRNRREIAYQRGGWLWSHRRLPDARALLPEAILRSTASSLEQLGASARDLLEYVALLRDGAPLALLARLSSRSLSALEPELEQLVAAGLVEPRGTIAQPVFGVSQPWLSDALEALTPPQSLREKKARILLHRSLENKEPLQIVRLAVDLGEKDLLGRYLFQAVDELTSRGLHWQAFQLLNDACRQHLIDRGEWLTMSRLAETALNAGELEQCQETVRDALARIMNSDQKAFLLLVLARVHLARGANVEAAGCLRRAHQLAPSGSELKIKAIAELLAALSRTGLESPTRRAARQVISLLGESLLRNQRGRLFRALFHFVAATQSEFSEAALYWITRSVRSEMHEEGLPEQSLCLLARHHLRTGNWSRGKALTDRLADLVRRVENPGLEVDVLSLKAVAARKRGLHREAEICLEQALEIRPGGERLLLDLHLQLARNACHQLALDRTLTHLERVDELRKTPLFDTDPISLALTRGWFHLMLGDSDRAWDEVARLRDEPGVQHDPRPYLLEGELRLRQGDLGRAQAAASAAVKRSGRWHWYVARSRLLQAEVALHQDRLPEAAAWARGVLLLARAAWSEPLESRAHLVKARCRLRAGELDAARAHGLRAWQVARLVERMGLRAQICQVLAEIALEEKDLARAMDWTLEGLDPLEQMAARLSEPMRSQFRSLHIAPLEEILIRIGRPGPREGKAGLSVSRFSAGLGSSPDFPGLLRDLGESLTRQLRPCAYALLLIQPDSGELRLEGSRGKVRYPPDAGDLQLLGRQVSVMRRHKGYTRALIRLQGATRMEGCLYLEIPGFLTESEADLIQAAGHLVDILLHRNRSRPTTIAGPSAGHHHSQDRPFVGDHPLVKTMLSDACRFAQSNGTVLLNGESGTGKEVLARLIHAESPRRKGPFVPVNCAALPPDLVESELFGHTVGSFTGATTTRLGLFEAANGGTLFLDEISSMPLVLQPRLLRVLQEKTTRRIGEHRERQVDVRVIAATNQDLRKLVEKGQFRADLYHRLSVLVLTLPPLRSRAADIPLLARHFLDKLQSRSGLEVVLTPKALRALMEYSYPGNVRELENILESLAFSAIDGTITERAVRARLQEAGMRPAPGGAGPVDSILSRLREEGADFWREVRDPFLARDLCREDVRALISRLLAECEGSYRRVLRLLKLPDSDYKRLMNFLEKHGCKVDFRPYRPAAAGTRRAADRKVG